MFSHSASHRSSLRINPPIHAGRAREQSHLEAWRSPTNEAHDGTRAPRTTDSSMRSCEEPKASRDDGTPTRRRQPRAAARTSAWQASRHRAVVPRAPENAADAARPRQRTLQRNPPLHDQVVAHKGRLWVIEQLMQKVVRATERFRAAPRQSDKGGFHGRSVVPLMHVDVRVTQSLLG
jgi:hypothetical protein